MQMFYVLRPAFYVLCIQLDYLFRTLPQGDLAGPVWPSPARRRFYLNSLPSSPHLQTKRNEPDLMRRNFLPTLDGLTPIAILFLFALRRTLPGVVICSKRREICINARVESRTLCPCSRRRTVVYYLLVAERWTLWRPICRIL